MKRFSQYLFLGLLALQGAKAQTRAPDIAPPAQASGDITSGETARPSKLTAPQFYQILLGELLLTSDPGAGFSLILDSARQTGDAQLYQRAVQMALQARAGDAALQAANAWKKTHPQSRDANRYVLQILLALNRPVEAMLPLRLDITLSPDQEQTDIIALTPSRLSQLADPQAAANLAEQALIPLTQQTQKKQLAAAAWAAIGHTQLKAQRLDKALEAARQSMNLDSTNEEAGLLTVGLVLAGVESAQPLVMGFLHVNPTNLRVRMTFAQALIRQNHLGMALTQMRTITQQHPEFSQAWLMLGALEMEVGDRRWAEAALTRYVQQTEAELATAPFQKKKELDQGLRQAYLALAKLMQDRGSNNEAQAWFEKINTPEAIWAMQIQKAQQLARQGALDEALKLIDQLPSESAQQELNKTVAKAQLLRQLKYLNAAYELLNNELQAGSEDADFIYELSLVAEMLGKTEQSETLLRQLLQLKPNDPLPYNALGYTLADRNEKLDEAKQLILKALEFNPQDPFVQDSLGWVEFRLGNLTTAIQILESAYKKQPDAEIGSHLGEVLWSAGQKEAARRIWKESLNKEPNNETLIKTLKRLGVQ